MKKLINLFLIGCITLINVLPVLAKTSTETYIDKKIVKYHYITEDGEEVIEYYDNIQLPEDNYYQSAYKSITQCTAPDKLCMQSTITYTSKLSGAYNNYKTAIAMSEATAFIDYMWVNLKAWYAEGTYLGSDTVSNSTNTKVGALSASVSVPTNPFNYQLGSAASEHLYRNSGYTDTSHSLSWTR